MILRKSANRSGVFLAGFIIRYKQCNSIYIAITFQLYYKTKTKTKILLTVRQNNILTDFEYSVRKF